MDTFLWLKRVTCRDAATRIISFLMPPDTKICGARIRIRRGPGCRESSFWYAIAEAGFVELVSCPAAARHFRDIAYGAMVGGHTEIVRFAITRKTWPFAEEACKMLVSAATNGRAKVFRTIIDAHYVPEMERIRAIHTQEIRMCFADDVLFEIREAMIRTDSISGTFSVAERDIILTAGHFVRTHFPAIPADRWLPCSQPLCRIFAGDMRE